MVVCPHCEREIDVPEIVELDPDQTLPKNPLDYPDFRTVWDVAHQSMIDAGWRKIR